jgi:hypothetical protein
MKNPFPGMKSQNYPVFLAAFALLALTAPLAFAQPNEQKSGLQADKAAPAYPLKKSANGRYLVDQNGTPFLIAGESPQALMVNLSEAEAELFFSNRRAHGFNAVWINLLCRPGTGGRPDGSTYDGVLPFAATNDLALPNDAYFTRCDRMLQLATKYGLLVILDPCETIDHLKLMVQNGENKCSDFGRYLGRRRAAAGSEDGHAVSARFTSRRRLGSAMRSATSRSQPSSGSCTRSSRSTGSRSIR